MLLNFLSWLPTENKEINNDVKAIVIFKLKEQAKDIVVGLDLKFVVLTKKSPKSRRREKRRVQIK